MITDDEINGYALFNILKEDDELAFEKIQHWIEGAKWMRDNWMRDDLNNFCEKHSKYPIVQIQRGDKILIQQRANEEELRQHIKDNYSDWAIVKSNFNIK
jgi:hypothetical protein